MTTNVTVTNLKGGVGKTTASGLLALFLTEHRTDPVVLIDVDPQCGSTSLFLGKDAQTLTIKDALVAAMEWDDTTGIIRDALVNVPGKPNMFVIPSDKRLADMISGIPADILLGVIQSVGFSDETTVIIDTGTSQEMVGMGICAADMVLIPMMMSKQTVKPTMNTLNLAARFHKPILGLLPMGSGEAQWENKILKHWQSTLDTSAALKPLGGVILPHLPFSKTLIRGAWAKLPFPVNLAPVFDVICARAFGRSTSLSHSIPECVEVLNG